jgi:hypothetical protein
MLADLLRMLSGLAVALAVICFVSGEDSAPSLLTGVVVAGLLAAAIWPDVARVIDRLNRWGGGKK